MNSTNPAPRHFVFDFPPMETQVIAARSSDVLAVPELDELSELQRAVDKLGDEVDAYFQTNPQHWQRLVTKSAMPETPATTISQDDVSGLPSQTNTVPDLPGGGGPPVTVPDLDFQSGTPADEIGRAAGLWASPCDKAVILPGTGHANVRRSAQLAKLIGLTSLVNLLVLGAAAFWSQRRLANDWEVRFESARSAPLAASKRATTAIASAGEQSLLPFGKDLSPSQAELVLLKERNRLTAYADESIATGARVPYERLWEALDDPRLAPLVHAARAEILRVQQFYLGGSRISRFDIPVATYFPQHHSLGDSQLTDDQLIKLLREKKNPWEVRMKAANLLGTRPSRAVGDALVAAVKDDDNLDVVKEATFSFEQITQSQARIFDVAYIELWWQEHKNTPLPSLPNGNPVPSNALAPDSSLSHSTGATASPGKGTEASP